MPKTQTYIRETQIHGDETREWLVSFGQESALTANSLYAVGWVAAAAGYEFLLPNPTLALIYATHAGSGEVLVGGGGGEWQTCGPGMAYLAPAGVPRGYRVGPEGSWQNCWVLSQDTSLLEVREPTLLRADARHLLNAIQGLYDEDMREAEVSMVESYVHLIRQHARRLGRPVALRHERQREVWERVLADLAYPWTARELAAIAFLSEEGFRLLCKRETGLSPMTYVTLLRMRHAAFLLLSEQLPVRVIAERVGYGNPMAFSTAFRRVMGSSPREYQAAKVARGGGDADAITAPARPATSGGTSRRWDWGRR